MIRLEVFGEAEAMATVADLLDESDDVTRERPQRSPGFAVGVISASQFGEHQFTVLSARGGVQHVSLSQVENSGRYICGSCDRLKEKKGATRAARRLRWRRRPRDILPDAYASSAPSQLRTVWLERIGGPRGGQKQ